MPGGGRIRSLGTEEWKEHLLHLPFVVIKTGSGFGGPVLKRALEAAQTQVRSQKSCWGWCWGMRWVVVWVRREETLASGRDVFTH